MVFCAVEVLMSPSEVQHIHGEGIQASDSMLQKKRRNEGSSWAIRTAPVPNKAPAAPPTSSSAERLGLDVRVR